MRVMHMIIATIGGMVYTMALRKFKITLSNRGNKVPLKPTNFEEQNLLATDGQPSKQILITRMKIGITLMKIQGLEIYPQYTKLRKEEALYG